VEDRAKMTRDPGWYERPDRPGVKRYYDGASWTGFFGAVSTPVDAPATAGAGLEPTAVGDFLLPGITLGVVGGAMFAGGASSDNQLLFFLGFAVAAIGGLTCLAAAVATGVRRGIRLADYDRKLRGE